MELLHEFCYHARKTIELSETLVPGTTQRANTIKLFETEINLGLEGFVPVVDKSLWWILNRVIHSREVRVLDHEDIEVGTKWAAAPRITGYATPMVFCVQSDKDSSDTWHHAGIEQLIEAFVTLTRHLDQIAHDHNATPI